MNSCKFAVFVLYNAIALLQLSQLSYGYMVGNNPYHRRETLDKAGKYQLEWLVEMGKKRVTFNVTVQTKGYVGFGLSTGGKMRGADIVIGGVRPNGKSYFSDRHAVGNQIPEVDPQQDWVLHAAMENQTHTFLTFSRAFDTCDPQDLPITEDTIVLIWSFGENDNDMEYHHNNRGVYNVYLLYPDYSPPMVEDLARPDRDEKYGPNSSSEIKVWTIEAKMELQLEETAYFCRMFKAPTLARKHHFIGWQVRFPDEVSPRHVHHLLINKCRPPPGRSAKNIFDRFLNHRGQLCYDMRTPMGPIPTEYCTELFNSWAIGGRSYMNPPQVGFPFGTSPDEYYLIQFHLDNVNHVPNVMLNVHLDQFYTSKLRPNEGGVVITGGAVPGLTPNILIPPSSIDQTVYGYCGAGCTTNMFPKEGVTVAGLIFHTHNSGTKVRVQHFRGNRELPWIGKDDNYNNQFQPYFPLHKEIKIMPGDVVLTRCINDNTWANGTIVGGFSTRFEMCENALVYYNKIDNLSFCRSQIESAEGRQRFLGINNVTWDEESLEYVVDPPHRLAGLKVTEVSDFHVNWTRAKRQELQRFHRYSPQIEYCNRGWDFEERNSNDNRISNYTGTTGYPQVVKDYRPEESCSFSNR